MQQFAWPYFAAAAISQNLTTSLFGSDSPPQDGCGRCLELQCTAPVRVLEKPSAWSPTILEQRLLIVVPFLPAQQAWCGRNHGLPQPQSHSSLRPLVNHAHCALVPQTRCEGVAPVQVLIADRCDTCALNRINLPCASALRPPAVPSPVYLPNHGCTGIRSAAGLPQRSAPPQHAAVRNVSRHVAHWHAAAACRFAVFEQNLTNRSPSGVVPIRFRQVQRNPRRHQRFNATVRLQGCCDGGINGRLGFHGFDAAHALAGGVHAARQHGGRRAQRAAVARRLPAARPRTGA